MGNNSGKNKTVFGITSILAFALLLSIALPAALAVPVLDIVHPAQVAPFRINEFEIGNPLWTHSTTTHNPMYVSAHDTNGYTLTYKWKVIRAGTVVQTGTGKDFTISPINVDVDTPISIIANVTNSVGQSALVWWIYTVFDSDPWFTWVPAGIEYHQYAGEDCVTFEMSAYAYDSPARYSWDWDNDGTYDTPLNTALASSNQCLTCGPNTIRGKVVDTNDDFVTQTKSFTLTSGCTTNCIDNDNDGYNLSAVNCGPVDCADSNANIYPARAESCNNLDDNCNNAIDETFPNKGQSCSAGQGICQRTGTYVCTATGTGTTCNAVPGTPTTEICGNGIDEDCNGSDLICSVCTNGQTQSCGTNTGACQTGTQTCNNNAWGSCAGQITPTTETCNNIDDDCDGSTDESLTQSCGIDTGACQVGTQTCNAGTFGSCVGQITPTTEICGNGIDEDCNGSDLTCPICTNGQTQSCGINTGACQTGTQTCVSNSWGACVGQITPTTEICGNGIDEDCNGSDLTCPICTNGQIRSCGGSNIGACRTGSQTCNSNSWGSCVGQINATTEICGNGIDEDCNGADLSCSAFCGNLIIEAPEVCDGNLLSCLSPLGYNGSQSCNPTCTGWGLCTSAQSCGDGIVNVPPEQCDDTNILNGDGCSAVCQLENPALCGNNALNPGETCDDGNTVSNDGCSATCQDEIIGTLCGNSVLEITEQCDDGNIVSGDGCSAVCLNEINPLLCGNGVIDFGETCDNSTGASTCASFNFTGGNLLCINCQLNTTQCTGNAGGFCGDSVIQPGEQCDLLNLAALVQCSNLTGYSSGPLSCTQSCMLNTSLCIPTAQAPICGNNVTEAGEQCDDGNLVSNDGCSATCQLDAVFCGNGIIDAGETCDGSTNGMTCGNFNFTNGTLSCGNNCQLNTTLCVSNITGGFCGDSIIQPGEQCDLLNYGALVQCDNLTGFVNGSLSCTPGCMLDTTACISAPLNPNCGNGVFDAGEQCDDSNLLNNDGCSDICVIEAVGPVCGDSMITLPIEQCDDSNNDNGDGCSAICTTEIIPPNCGNGLVDSGEECDPDAMLTTACTNLDSFTGGTLSCTPFCKFDTTQCTGGITGGFCGDNFINPGESCDGTNLGLAVQCTDLGSFVSGPLSCTATCTLDTSICIPGSLTCGDGTLDAGEQCDDGNLVSNDGCSAVCFDELAGAVCGNSIWEAGEQCDDGNLLNNDGCSDLCIIENFPPIITSIILLPNPVMVNGTLVCAVQANDPENNTITVSYSWTTTGAYSLAGITGNILDLSLITGEQNGDVITCTAVPNDGTQNGTSMSASANVTDPSRPNVPPVVTIITPLNGDTFVDVCSNITFTATANDPDGDSIASWLWTALSGVNISSASTFNLPASAFAAGNNTVYAFAFDDFMANQQMGSDNVTFTITQHTAPTATMTITNLLTAAVLANGTGVNESTPLQFLANALPTDACNAGQFNYFWTDNGVFMSSQQIFSLSNLSIGWHTISVFVTDQYGAFTQVSLRIQILDVPNQLPIVQIMQPTNAISISSMQYCDINFSATANDVDGWIMNPGNEIYNWMIVTPIGVLNPSLQQTFLYTGIMPLGNSTAIVSVTDNDGGLGQDSLIISVLANQPPQTNIMLPVAFPNFTVPERTSISFDAQVIGGNTDDCSDCSLADYSWNWIDASTGIILSAQQAFTVPELSIGLHTITVTTTDCYGDIGIDTIIVNVTDVPNNAPIVTISSPLSGQSFVNVCENVPFSASAIDLDNEPITQWMWIYNGPVISNLASFIMPASQFALGNNTVYAYAFDNQTPAGIGSSAVNFTIVDHTGPAVTLTATEMTTPPGTVLVNGSSVNESRPIQFDGAAFFTDACNASTYQWRWFDNGMIPPISTMQSFTTSSLSVGIHNILLEVIDQYGYSGYAAITLNITQVPNIPPMITSMQCFDKATGSATLTEFEPIFCNATAVDADGVITTWLWDVDNDGFSPQVAGSVFDLPALLANGTYLVSLTVIDNGTANGLPVSATQVLPIVVNNNAPVVNLTGVPASGTEPLNVTFTCSITGGNQPFTYWFDFGDGITTNVLPNGNSTSITYNYVYLQNGTYTATCNVQDNDGDTGNDSTITTVLDTAPMPEFNWTLFSPIENTAVQFTDLSTAYDGIVSWSWDFNDADGITVDSTLQNPTFVFVQNGNYVVTLTVMDGDGTLGTVQHTVVVNDTVPQNLNIVVLPIPPTFQLEGQNVSFIGFATAYDMPITYSWDFGDGTPAQTGQILNHVYAQQGNYTVTLTVTDSDGSPTSTSTIVQILDTVPTAVAVATPSVTMEGRSVEFNGSLSFGYAGDQPYTYSWYFADGSANGTGAVLNHTFMVQGTYNVVLTVTDTDGSVSTDTVQVIVIDSVPVSVAGPFPCYGVEGLPVVLDGSASIPSTDLPNDYYWDFNASNGVGIDATGVIVNTVYTDNGVFNVTLNVTDGDGSSDTSRTVCIINDTLPVITSITPDLILNEGDSAVFTVTATGTLADPISLYSWRLPNGTVLSGFGLTSLPYTFPDNGNFNITVRIDDEDSSVFGMINVTVLNVAPVVNIIGAPYQCDRNAVVPIQVYGIATDASPVDFAAFTAASYTWDFNYTAALGFSTDATNFTADLNCNGWPIGMYNISFRATDKDGGIGQTTALLNVTTGIVNQPPFFFPPLGLITVVNNTLMTYDANATDSPTQSLTYSTDSVLIAINSTTGVITWTPTVVGLYQFNITVCDNSTQANACTSDWLFVNVVPQPSLSVVLLTPTNNLIQVGNPLINFSGYVMSSSQFIINCSLYVGSVGTPWALEAWGFLTNNTIRSYQTGFADGTYSWNLFCDDGINTAWAPQNFTFTVNSSLSPQCSDASDNDVDGLTDMADPGCTSALDNDETDIVITQCSDGIDNDGDGDIDYPADFGCSNGADNDEVNNNLAFQCSDGIDNDADALIDQNDPGCTAFNDISEINIVGTQCSDGIDNDGDGDIDYPTDFGCVSSLDNTEVNNDPSFQCSDGLDNDGDTLVDQNDPGCITYDDNSEINVVVTQCSDGIDNDGDAAIDLADFGCINAADNNEINNDPAFQCSDGIDNDADGLIDQADPDCSARTDTIEAPQCSDGIDNDADALTDWPFDPGCASAIDIDETNPVPLPQCFDNVDNDADGFIDFPYDPGCQSAGDNDETDPATPTQCWNGVDDADPEDIIIDFPLDPGCYAAGDNDETNIVPAPECSDGINNDGDAFGADYPNDPGCYAAGDPTESPDPSPLPQCADTLDNDGDGKFDFTADPGCYAASDNNEVDYGFTGLVIDFWTGLPVSGATVTALQGTTTILTTTTDASGNYDLSALSPGIYDVRVSMAGYITQTISNRVIYSTRDTMLSFALGTVIP